MVRTKLALAAALLLPVAVPAAASAAGTASVSSGVMTVTAGSGDQNYLGIGLGSYLGNNVYNIFASDSYLRPLVQIPVTAGTGCTTAATIFAECSNANFTSIEVNSGDRNDRLYSNQDDTTFNAGTGDDWMVVGAGANVQQDYNGDSGNDTVSYAGGPYALSASIDGTRNDGYLSRGKIGSDVERIIGGNAGDTLTGASSTRTTLMGQDGNDSLTAGAVGGDLYGGKGNDTLTGGTGDDEFWDTVGADTMIGGSGDDTFHADDDNANDSISCGAGYDVVFVDDIIEIADWDGDGSNTSCEQIVYY